MHRDHISNDNGDNLVPLTQTPIIVFELALSPYFFHCYTILISTLSTNTKRQLFVVISLWYYRHHRNYLQTNKNASLTKYLNISIYLRYNIFIVVNKTVTLILLVVVVISCFYVFIMEIKRNNRRNRRYNYYSRPCNGYIRNQRRNPR